MSARSRPVVYVPSGRDDEDRDRRPLQPCLPDARGDHEFFHVSGGSFRLNTSPSAGVACRGQQQQHRGGLAEPNPTVTWYARVTSASGTDNISCRASD